MRKIPPTIKILLAIVSTSTRFEEEKKTKLIKIAKKKIAWKAQKICINER